LLSVGVFTLNRSAIESSHFRPAVLIAVYCSPIVILIEYLRGKNWRRDG